MGKIFKFPKTNSQIRGTTTKKNYMYIETLPTQSGTLTYNGQEQRPTWLNLDPLKVIIGGTTSAVNADKYYMTVTPTGNFAWTDNTQDTKQIEWVIKRKAVAAVPAQKNTLTYNGQVQSPTWNNYNSAELTLGGTTSAVNAGSSYKAKFTPTSNYCWSDESVTAKEVAWKIGVLKLNKATLTKNSFDYTGSAVTPSLSDFNEEYMTKSGDTSATNKGDNYKIIVALKDKTNTAWSDGTTADLSLAYSIGAASVAIPVLGDNYTYDEKEHYCPFEGFSDSDDFDNDDWSLGEGSVYYATDAGSYPITLVLKDKTNKKWSDGTTSNKKFTWKINQKAVPKPTLIDDQKHVTWEGDNTRVEPGWNDFNYDDWYAERDYTYLDVTLPTDFKVGTKVTKFKLINDNYKWTSGTGEVERTWYIDKRKLDFPSLKYNQTLEKEYTGDDIEWEFDAGDNWSDYNIDFNDFDIETSEDMINAGSKEYKLTPKDTDHYEWDSKKTSTEGVIYLKAFVFNKLKIVPFEMYILPSYAFEPSEYEEWFLTMNAWEILQDYFDSNPDKNFFLAAFDKSALQAVHTYDYNSRAIKQSKPDLSEGVHQIPLKVNANYRWEGQSSGGGTYNMPVDVYTLDKDYTKYDLRIDYSTNGSSWINAAVPYVTNVSVGQVIYLKIQSDKATKLAPNIPTAYFTSSTYGTQTNNLDLPGQCTVCYKLTVKAVPTTYNLDVTVTAPAYQNSPVKITAMTFGSSPSSGGGDSGGGDDDQEYALKNFYGGSALPGGGKYINLKTFTAGNNNDYDEWIKPDGGEVRFHIAFPSNINFSSITVTEKTNNCELIEVTSEHDAPSGCLIYAWDVQKPESGNFSYIFANFSRSGYKDTSVRIGIIGWS